MMVCPSNHLHNHPVHSQVNTATYHTLTHVDTLWCSQCVALGWDAPPPPTSTWWSYFSRRMTIRHAVRSMVRRVLAFLGRASQSALMPGCTITILQACDQRLRQQCGSGLPWELWELYRFRNGQADIPGAVFFNGACRLLPCPDAVLMHCHEHVNPPIFGGGGRGEGILGGQPNNHLLMVVSTAERGGRKYAVSLVDGSVWWVSGFATRRLGGSLVEVLRQMLR